ncbi:hypothetical protein CPC08DRAFT_731704, partial [Agrocybe pediades]
MYLSWSPSLREALPRWLSMRFTYHLTHRGGLTDTVVSLLRASFLHGTGPTLFAEMIQVNHFRHYEDLQLQFLEMVYARQHSIYANFLGKLKPSGFGKFNDCDSYAGFVPSPHYFRNFYIKFIASHASSIDQYTAMMSAARVPKHLGKIQGVPVFPGGLNTGINEYSEIRYMNFASTKSQNQFIPALMAVSESLATFGHHPIKLIFTDNSRADAAAIESAIPSMTRDVVPVPNPSQINELTLPNDVSIITLSSTFQINTRFNTIIAKVSEMEKTYVAFDIEWPVNLSSGIHRAVTRGRIATVIRLGNIMGQPNPHGSW